MQTPPQLVYYLNAPEQHRINLEATLRALTERGDYASAASVASVLLSSHRPLQHDAMQGGVGPHTTQHLPRKVVLRQHREYDHLLQVCSEILIRASLDQSQLRELLQTISRSHESAYAAEAARLNLVGWLLETSMGDTSQEEERGGPHLSVGASSQATTLPSTQTQPSSDDMVSEALSLLEMKERLNGRHNQEHNKSHVLRSIQEFTRCALSGLIAHGRVQHMIGNMASEGTGAQIEDTVSSSILVGASTNDPRSIFTYDSKVWLRLSADRGFKEAWRESERNLLDAIKIHPEVTLLSFALCHLYAMAGKMPQALETSRAAVLSSPTDIDAVTLHLMLSRSRGEVESEEDEGGEDVARGEDVHRFSSLNAKALEVDGRCREAVSSLLSSCSHCPSCMLRAAQGMMRHLDVGEEGDPLAWSLEVWACLAGCVAGIAEIREATVRAREEREEMDGIEISLAQAEEVPLTEEELLGLVECTDEEVIWDDLLEELESRAWWQRLGYFSMPPAGTTMEADIEDLYEEMRRSTLLIHRAVVCSFMVSCQDPFVQLARQQATRVLTRGKAWGSQGRLLDEVEEAMDLLEFTSRPGSLARHI